MLAQYRVLSIAQIALLEGVNPRSARRLMKRHLDRGLVQTIERCFSGTKGRPEGLFCLSEKGVDSLKENQLFESWYSNEKLGWHGRRNLEHQIGANWVLIHVKMLEKFAGLKTESISHTSPFHPESETGAPFIHDSVPSNADPSRRIGFTPDAVFLIKNPAQERALLFFLEYDRATEPLAGGAANSISRKIQNYREYFRRGGYKRYDQVFGGSFNGFRLLFITESKERLSSLCRLVLNRKPSKFIWLTLIDEIRERGIGANIWIRGGRMENPRVSILGSSLSFDLGEAGQRHEEV
ncbi:MAG: hypothetical protein GC154_20380 [bacterium]|nr:hypothetical protein [bacterium]